jgi:hypothetical protein
LLSRYLRLRVRLTGVVLLCLLFALARIAGYW